MLIPALVIPVPLISRASYIYQFFIMMFYEIFIRFMI